jgi:hypothetical protein
MQEKRKRSKTSIIIAVVAAVLLIVMIVVWRQYEAKHKDELQASVLTTDVSQAPIEEDEPEPEPAVPKQVIPDDPDELLVMAEEALKDEGYFEKIGRERGKGDHVHFLLKKCLDCEGDPGKVQELAKRLKERSDEGYGPWRVDSAALADLDERVEAAKQL